MKLGFNKKVETILRKNLMRNGMGWVSKLAPRLAGYLTSLKYHLVDEDTIPDYNLDFIYLTKAEWYLIPQAFTSLERSGIIILSLGEGKLNILRKDM
jgi:hypothetical protein